MIWSGGVVTLHLLSWHLVGVSSLSVGGGGGGGGGVHATDMCKPLVANSTLVDKLYRQGLTSLQECGHSSTQN